MGQGASRSARGKRSDGMGCHCEERQACKTEAAEGRAERLIAAHNPYAIDIFEQHDTSVCD